MNKVELLAPAKNLETAIAAINSGADAIYIGASDFGARVNAANTLESVEKLVNYAHKFYVRVHVTINTILNNDELKKAFVLINNLYKIGVDAIIIQDLGILEFAVKNKLPPIQIHMSTQCNNRDLDKVKFFDEIGVSRVILARELSLENIKEICNSTSCEIETFIHGALCVCYSGQCYFSYANGGRSANRGECAQPCRKKYSLVDENGKMIIKDKYLLSLKDFNASNHIKSLIDLGVKSFKIEGRLKDINYVKNVTAYYNNLINTYANRTSSGKVFLDFEPNVMKTFNRAYTDYFLDMRRECYNFSSPKFIGEKLGKVKKISRDYFEIDAEIHKQDGLCFFNNDVMTGFLVNNVDGNKIYPNKMPKLSIGSDIYRNIDFEFNKKLSNSTAVRKIRVDMTIDNNILTARDEDGNTTCLDIISDETANNPDLLRDTYIKQLSKLGNSDFYLGEITITTSNLPFLPVSKINELRRELLQNLMEVRIKNYPKIVQKPICYTNFPTKKVDYRANVYNDYAEKFYNSCNCKVCEHAVESNARVNKNVELMRTKHCLRFSAGLCSKKQNYSKNLYLQDENGKKYLLKFDCKNCEMVILNSD